MIYMIDWCIYHRTMWFRNVLEMVYCLRRTAQAAASAWQPRRNSADEAKGDFDGKSVIFRVRAIRCLRQKNCKNSFPSPAFCRLRACCERTE